MIPLDVKDYLPFVKNSFKFDNDDGDFEQYKQGFITKNMNSVAMLPASPCSCVLTWLSGSEHSSVGLEHCIVDELLVLSERAISREGAGDVRSVAAVLSTHVKQAGQDGAEATMQNRT